MVNGNIGTLNIKKETKQNKKQLTELIGLTFL